MIPSGERRKSHRSKTGLIFAALYTAAAMYLFHEAMTCIGIACDLLAFFVWLPAGYIYWFPFSGVFGNYVPNPMSRWEFVIPTAVSNIVVYYFFGSAVGAGFRKFVKRPAG